MQYRYMSQMQQLKSLNFGHQKKKKIKVVNHAACAVGCGRATLRSFLPRSAGSCRPVRVVRTVLSTLLDVGLGCMFSCDFSSVTMLTYRYYYCHSD